MTPQELTELRAKAVAATVPDGASYDIGYLNQSLGFSKEDADFIAFCTPELVIALVDELSFAQRDADQRWHKRYEQACQETRAWQARYEALVREISNVTANLMPPKTVIVVKNSTVEDYNEHH